MVTTDRLITQTEIEAPLELVGGKAKGLLRLKSLEEKLNENLYRVKVYVPPFFIVPPGLSVIEHKDEILRLAQELESENYAVRSSSPLEDLGEHSFAGIFDSKLNVPNENLAIEILNVRGSSRSGKARRYANEICVSLEDKIPVIVQAMADKTVKGHVYSKFPSPQDILKIVRWRSSHRRDIDVFYRFTDEDGKVYGDYLNPLVTSIGNRSVASFRDDIEYPGIIALKIENEFGYPVIMEFNSTDLGEKDGIDIFVLQARRLNKLSDAEKFEMSELQEEGLIATTEDVNGVGDVTGKAYVLDFDYVDGPSRSSVEDMVKFDSKNRDGYILVAPYLQFSNQHFDEYTIHKKAVLAYTDLGERHDFEVAREKRILYLNCAACLTQGFYHIKYGGVGHYKEKMPIKTGETIRVVSDGVKGLVFNLSRK